MPLSSAGTGEVAAGLRIAWFGPAPQAIGGVPGMATLVLDGLLRLGHEIDCYVSDPALAVPAVLRDRAGLRLIPCWLDWRVARLARDPALRFAVGQSQRLVAQRQLATQLLAEHRARPYDVVYQFSQIELFALRRHLRDLPPIVMHPETHLAGELRWFRRERALARRCEPWPRRLLVHLLLRTRTAAQRRHVRHAAGFICPSRVFRDWLVRDYGIDPARTFVVPNPVDLERFHPVDRDAAPWGPSRALFVGRMSVRKGVDLLVELSHRLADLSGELHLELVGDWTMWSDYRPLLVDLHPGVATYSGKLPNAELAARFAAADFAIQPSKYEPFGITVAESLASGTPVVATDEVGAAEDLPAACAIVVPVDAGALERAVREMHARASGAGAAAQRSAARAAAAELFHPDRVSRGIAAALAELVALHRGTAAR